LIKCKSSQTRTNDETLINLAKAFQSAHDYVKARECLHLIKNKKGSPTLIIVQAEIERDDHKYAAALEFYQQALNQTKSNEQHVDILIAQGFIYVSKAEYSQGKERFHQALDRLQSDSSKQKRAEILNACGLIAKKCSEVTNNNRCRIRSVQ
jgi:tetratricopeptide (TPR) repeat protein